MRLVQCNPTTQDLQRFILKTQKASYYTISFLRLSFVAVQVRAILGIGIIISSLTNCGITLGVSKMLLKALTL